MSRPWLAHYDPGVPHSLAPYPETTLADVVDASARERPGATALVFKGARLGYGALAAASDACAAALYALGVRRGDRVALLLPNCPQFVIAELGAWKAGATVVPLNPIYTDDELARPLAETEATTIVVLTPLYERVKRIQPRTRLTRIVATNIKEHLPPLLRLLFTLFKERREGHRIRLRAGDLWLADLLRAHAGAPPPPERARPDDTALILMSGGTTGVPKGVLAPHRGVMATGLQTRAWLQSVMKEWQDVVMLPLPLFHAAAGILAQSTFLIGRNPVLLVPNPRDLDDVLQTIHRQRPDFFGGVPTLFAALLNHPDVRSGRIDFRSLKLCFCGAAPLMQETRREFESLTGGTILEAYSLTEALTAVIANPALGEKKAGSVGMPGPDVEVRIMDQETGTRALATGEVGEITIRAPQVMPGYWRQPEETAVALRDHGDGGVWLHTGDLGYLDGDGYVFIVDRMKDLIKPGGYQVWPREVEEALATHPAVAEAGVAGVPDAVRGEAVKAWVVLRPGASASVDEIREHCKAQLAPYKVPKTVEFRSELPKTMVGKVLRRALVDEHRRSAGSEIPSRHA